MCQSGWERWAFDTSWPFPPQAFPTSPFWAHKGTPWFPVWIWIWPIFISSFFKSIDFLEPTSTLFLFCESSQAFSGLTPWTRFRRELASGLQIRLKGVDRRANPAVKWNRWPCWIQRDVPLRWRWVVLDFAWVSIIQFAFPPNVDGCWKMITNFGGKLSLTEI